MSVVQRGGLGKTNPIGVGRCGCPGPMGPRHPENGHLTHPGLSCQAERSSPRHVERSLSWTVGPPEEDENVRVAASPSVSRTSRPRSAGRACPERSRGDARDTVFSEEHSGVETSGLEHCVALFVKQALGRKNSPSGRRILAQAPDTARSQPDLSTPAFGLRSR
jgi:hypothetical protein